MKLAIMSDLHLEFHKDKGVKFIESLNPEGVDVLVLAGDIAEIKYIGPAIELFCQKYPKVVMVLGNHSYYTSNKAAVLENIEFIKNKCNNFYLLNNDVLEISGKRFLGTTLWYGFIDPIKAMYWSDFRYISDLGKWVDEEHLKSIKFLEENLKENDIVITHFLPSHKCVAKKYLGDSSNIFYVVNMEPLIEERKPALWLFGHTHTHMDLKINQTRLLANPRGYTMFNESLEETKFDDRLILDV